MPAARKIRIGEALRAELYEVIRRELRDPRLSAGLLSITDVAVSADLKFATVYISMLGEPQAQQEAVKALQGAAGLLRTELRNRKSFKAVPELTFRYDESLARGAKMFDLLEETRRNDAAIVTVEDPA